MSVTPKVAPATTVAVWFSVIMLLAAKTTATLLAITRMTRPMSLLPIFKSLHALENISSSELKNVQNDYTFGAKTE
jgi:hypothetical protein